MYSRPPEGLWGVFAFVGRAKGAGARNVPEPGGIQCCLLCTRRVQPGEAVGPCCQELEAPRVHTNFRP